MGSLKKSRNPDPQVWSDAFAGIPFEARRLRGIDPNQPRSGDGETGALVPFRDVSALTEAAAAMLSDPGHARQLGQAARQRALAMLDPEVLDAHERDTYARLLAGQLPQPGG